MPMRDCWRTIADGREIGVGFCARVEMVALGRCVIEVRKGHAIDHARRVSQEDCT